MSMLLSYCTIIIRSSFLLHRIRPPLPPPSLPFIFSQLSSHRAIPPSQDDDDNTQTPHNPISEFLLNECGLSPSQLTKVMRTRASLSRVRSTQTARGAVEVLRDLGFTPDQVNNTIVGSPSLLVLKVDTQLKPKIDFLKTLGLNAQDVGNVILKEPRVLCFSLEKHLASRIPYLEKLFGSGANLCKAIRRVPSLLKCNVEKQVNHNLDLLKQYGVQGELLLHLISIGPYILTKISEESLKLRLEYIKNMGILEGSKTFVYVLRTLCRISPGYVEKKLKNLVSLGFGEDKIRQLVMKDHRLLDLSMNKLQENMDFLVHVAGLLPNNVVKYPVLFNFSIEKRLKPRHNVFKALCSMQQKKRLPSLVYIFKLSEKEFLQKYVECSPRSSILKDIYRAKGNAADVRNI